MEPLPKFRYHPDPLETESIERSDQQCLCCGQGRGYIYAGPVFSLHELHDKLCPWCIATGAAHEKFDASFVDEPGVGGYGTWEPVPRNVVEEIAYRTPSFVGWQQAEWFTCCGDGAAFLGRAGVDKLTDQWREAIPVIKSASTLSDDDWPGIFESLDKDGSPTAYVFRCLHCGRLGGYLDFD